jgi:hypothetical protein
MTLLVSERQVTNHIKIPRFERKHAVSRAAIMLDGGSLFLHAPRDTLLYFVRFSHVAYAGEIR